MTISKKNINSIKKLLCDDIVAVATTQNAINIFYMSPCMKIGR